MAGDAKIVSRGQVLWNISLIIMVFITLGTQGDQFVRCLQMVEQLIEELKPNHEFIAQVGHTRYQSDKITLLPFVSETEFKEYIAKADIVITHAGSGALFSSIQKGKKAIAVARLHKYNEMTNDHQTELVRKLSEDGYILDGTHSLIDAWKKLDGFNPRPCDFTNTLVEEIGKQLDNWLK